MLPLKRATGLGLILLLLSSCASLRPPKQAVDRLKPCLTSEGPTDGYCGKLEVWENRGTRSGRKLPLKIVVLPGLKRNTAPDPLFFLAGGPGQAAAKMARQVREIFNNVQVDRDLVLVDQRGTGDSNPLECKSDDDSLEPDPDKSLQDLRTCLASYTEKADVRLYTTNIAMDDLDEVRQFLGYSKINLYGGSYGTRAAITYARRHNDSVRSAILDGVAPTELKLPLYMARDGQRALNLLVRDCEKDPACSRRFPDLGNRLKRLIDRLEAHPERVRIRHPRTGEEVEVKVGRPTIASVLFGALYSSQTAALIPLLIERAEKNDFEGFLALGGSDEAANLALGMQMSVLCSEDTLHVDRAALERETAGTFFGYELSSWRVRPCEFWPRGDVDGAYYEPAVGNVPALILSGELDPVTPPSWGELVAKQWKGARHVVVPGNGHGSIVSGCVMKVIGEFLDKGASDNLNVDCIQHVHRPPFFLGGAGPNPDGALKQ